MYALRIGRVAPLVLAVAVLGACGSDISDPAEPQVSATVSGSAEPSLSGTFAVSGRELYLECSGEGERSEDLASGLHGLLENAEVPGPYVLVGHSAGGILVQAAIDEVLGASMVG